MAASPTLSQNPEPTPTVETDKSDSAIIKNEALTSEAVVSLEGAAMLTGINFEYSSQDQSPTIKFAISKRGEYRFSKLDEKSYELSLPGYNLAKNHLALPQFPPQDFNGITFVRAGKKNDTIQIIIGIERGTRLSPISKDNEILIRIGN